MLSIYGRKKRGEMQTKTIDIQSSSVNFQELLNLVMTGMEVIITEGNAPIARIVPIDMDEGDRQPGMHPGAIQMGENFDAPLPDEFWLGQS